MQRSSIKAIRGMNDILPPQSSQWQFIEATLGKIMQRYGYAEIRFPLLEHTALFKRSIGDVTDIVEKEMYSFQDRNGDMLSLRPEGTACCVRAALEHGLLYHQTPRLWYLGPFYRHERPQQGRYRQFHQFGVEAFGVATPDIDAEIIALAAAIFAAFQLTDVVTLHINSLGNPEQRGAYRTALVAYLTSQQQYLDEESVRRLTTNPLRILDSKHPEIQRLVQAAPKLLDFLDGDAEQHHRALLSYLDALGIRYTLNPNLVRGLDYYNHTVFEWVAPALGTQGTVCAGGRYDGLVEQLGGKPTPAFGFALGMERLYALLSLRPDALPMVPHIDAYLVSADAVDPHYSVLWAEKLRAHLPTLKLIAHCGGGHLKAQLKKADNSGAYCALIVGAEERHSGTTTVKFLRNDRPQQRLNFTELLTMLQEVVYNP